MSLILSRKIRPTLFGIFVSFVFLWAGPSGWTLEPSEVLILVNKDVSVSSRVAAMYQKARAIPAANILKLSLGTSRDVSREEYRARIAAPVREQLERRPEIRSIVTTSGVPYTIRNSGGKQDGGALDNELAAVLRDEPRDLHLWQPNPLDLRGQNLSGTRDPRTVKMVYVARLDGPDLATVTRMVVRRRGDRTGRASGACFCRLARNGWNNRLRRSRHANQSGRRPPCRGGVSNEIGHGRSDLDSAPRRSGEPGRGRGVLSRLV